MKFRQIALRETKQGGQVQGIAILEDGTPVWATVREEDQLPVGVLRYLELRDLKVDDKREPTPEAPITGVRW